MKGDFSRLTFDPARHYQGVTLQQGRVQTDADANEQQAITRHRIEREAADLIGGCGAPIHHAGFAITPDGDDLLIGPGRYYVQGVLCENEEAVHYMAAGGGVEAQPDYPLGAAFLAGLPDPPVLLPPDEDGTYLVYLDVWTRHLTALEEPHIREVALGGPDTATRLKTVWQVRLHRLTGTDPDPEDVHCLSAVPSWDEATAPSTGELGARAEAATASADPCVVAPGAGYRRLENQLYRVEVHEGGGRNDISVKWDRDNGSIVTRLEDQSPDLTQWTVTDAGRDAVLRFAPDDWVELTDDTRELHGLPGTLVRVTGVEGNVITVDLGDRLPAGGTVDLADFPADPKVRRWNGVLRDITNQDYRDLEDGVQVRIRGGSGPDGEPRRYHTGDYWMIPARTNTGEIEWPTENDGWRGAEGIHHDYCRLALVTFSDDSWDEPVDCRKLFPPVTELTSLFYVGGDGQECLPGDELPLPLRVGVANGTHPVEGARVRFTVTSGSDEIAGTSGGTLVDELVVATDADGVAACFWTPADVPLTVDAELLDVAGDPVHLAVRFGANLSTAGAVEYLPGDGCAMPDSVTTVQAALDELCRREGDGCAVVVAPGPDWQERVEALLEDVTELHLCFQAGRYELNEPLRIRDKGHVSLTGCGPATRFTIEDAETVFDARGCASIRFADFYAEAGFAGDGRDDERAEHLNGVLNVVECGAATLDRVIIQCAGGIRRAVTGLTVRDVRDAARPWTGPHSVRVQGCTIGIGHAQTGVLLADVDRAVVEDNRLYVTGRSTRFDVHDWLRGDAHLRRVLRDVMLADPVAALQELPERDPGPEMRRRLLRAGLTSSAVEVRAAVGSGDRAFRVSFFTTQGLERLWPALLDAHPMETGNTEESAIQHLETLRARVLGGALDSEPATDMAEWLLEAVTNLPPVASQGVVVAKGQAPAGAPPAPDVRILNNRIEGCRQGVHVGASHREANAGGEPDYADTIHVTGNTIDLVLSPETSRERHGVFVGNARHIAVQDNRIRVARTQPGGAWDIDGIRLWGCFGPLVIARQNHIDGATVGVRVDPLDDDCWPDTRHWYVADNVAPGAESAVLVASPVLAERNVP